MRSISQIWAPSTLAGKASPDFVRDPSAPSKWEVLLMFVMVYGLHLFTVCRVKNFWTVAYNWFDNPRYLQVAAIIRQWKYSGGSISHFWGFPYLIAGVSKLFSLPGLASLVLISALSSLIVCIFLQRLYGGWVAAATLCFINYRWIYSTAEGGSEPLFMCLVFASFLAARNGRWKIAGLVASLATTVRPVGILVLVAFAVTLMKRKNYRQLTAVALIGSGIGILYFIPLWILLGNPFANFSGYRGDWGPQGWPLTVPFLALIRSFLTDPDAHWSTVTVSVVWIALVLAGVVAMWLPRNRKQLGEWFEAEALFTSLYALFFLSYNYVEGVALDFPRFLMPIFPLLVFSLRHWIPRNRAVLWGAAALSALLASAAMVGFRNVFGFALR